jgi:enoyl-CoA hydratase/carnithine racemase
VQHQTNITPDTAVEPAYFTAYKNFAVTRTPSGVLTVRFHTGGGPLTFTGTTHSQFPRLLEDIAFDRANQVVILTGTGEAFIDAIDGPSLGDVTKPMASDVDYMEGRRIVQRLADLEMPLIAAVNGPASVHSEYALLADVIIASDTTVFSDFPHLAFGIVPGDGVHVAWEEALGLNRARHLIMTGGSFTAQQALSWGAIAEVVPLAQVLPRAQAIAENLAARPQLLNRYIAVTIRQRLSRRLADGAALGLALEALTAANLPYVQQLVEPD